MIDISEVTQEQLDALESKVVELEKVKDESTAKATEFEVAKTDWEKKEKEYQEQANPNWQKARQEIDRLKAVAKEKGVEFNEDGSVKSNPQQIDLEQIRQEAANAARGELLGGRLTELLSEYEPESAKVVEHYYKKLTNGESVNLQNIKSYVQQAENAARGNPDSKITRVAGYSGGFGPRTPEVGKLDDKQANELGAKLGLPFASKK